MKIRILFLAIFLGLSNIAFAQVTFEAEVSRTRLGINERLRVDFKMNQDGDNFQPPAFESFRVVGGPNQSVSNRWINGQRSYSKTYSYYLEPTRRGSFTIGQAEITVQGETYKTVPITVEVSEAVDEPTDGENVEFIASDNLHLVAEISNTNPFLNEPITVVYKLYVSPRISVSNWREIDNPTYGDFWSQNIDIRELSVQNGEFRGEPYRFVELRKTILYPQKTGELEIEPLALSVSVEVPTERRSFFGSRVFTTVDKTITAGSRTIDVKPLPTEGRPADFTGAVGRDMKLEVSTDKTELDATESLQAEVKVSGKGNLKLFTAPALSVPASIEMYDPEHIENVQTNLGGMQGSISDRYTLVPGAQGDYPIPAISFSYFDLNTKSYRTLTSDEILINVRSGPIIAAGSANNTPSVGKVPVVADANFRYIKLNTTLKPIGSSTFLGSILFWSLMALPVVLIPALIIIGKKREAFANDIRANKIRKADRLAKRYLSEAKKNLGDQKTFYESLERALHNFLKAKLHIPTSEMSKEHIDRLLTDKKVKEESISDFTKILENCEQARYAPINNVEMNRDYASAVQVISEIDKQL